MREVSVCNITADIVNTGTRHGNNSTRLHSKDSQHLPQKIVPNKKRQRHGNNSTCNNNDSTFPEL